MGCFFANLPGLVLSTFSWQELATVILSGDISSAGVIIMLLPLLCCQHATFSPCCQIDSVKLTVSNWQCQCKHLDAFSPAKGLVASWHSFRIRGLLGCMPLLRNIGVLRTLSCQALVITNLSVLKCSSQSFVSAEKSDVTHLEVSDLCIQSVHLTMAHGQWWASRRTK